MLIRSLLAAAVSLALVGQAQAVDQTASIEQNGNNNTAEVTQLGGTYLWTELAQNGDSNEATVTQAGTNVSVEATQQGVANQLTATQEGFGTWVRSHQEGEGNLQSIVQRSEGGVTAYVYQYGVDNEAYVVQNDGDYNDGRINQHGQQNVLRLEQTYILNSLDATQEGTRNLANVRQTGHVTAQINQTGLANDVDLQQGAYSRANAVISQTGEYNEASVSQSERSYDSSSDLYLTQTGASNKADVYTGTAEGLLDFTQIGTGNELIARQGVRNGSVTGISRGDYNEVFFVQTGDGNTLDLAQSGADNVIEAFQMKDGASGDVGIIDQTGTGNYARLTQGIDSLGSGMDTAAIMQNGMNNSATVTQR